MKIKLAILEKDQNYLTRMVEVFGTKYSDKLEIYSFSDPGLAMSELRSNRIDVFVASNDFDLDLKEIPQRCGFAYFVDPSGVETVNGQKAICKFQRAEMIYKQILSIYAEVASEVSGLRFDDSATKVIIFSSPCGGTGTSSVAAACAVHFADAKKRVLYLDLEKFGAQSAFFHAEGSSGFSDVIYALKSRKANLSMKLESSLKQDDSGVWFYSPSKVALDMMELTGEDILRMISELKLLGAFDYIVIDMDFAVDAAWLKVYGEAHAMVWVGDGREISGCKIQRAYEAVSILEQNADAPLTNRIGLIYNKFSSKTGKTVGDIGIREIGGAPRCENASSEQIVRMLSGMELFEKII